MSDTLRCCACHRDLPVTDFYEDKRKLSGRCGRCRACTVGQNFKYKERKRQVVRDAKNVPCMDCGLHWPYYVMDMDHVRGEKKLTLGSDTDAGSLQKVIDEIAKCDAVCANCHRERTYQKKQHMAPNGSSRNKQQSLPPSLPVDAPTLFEESV